MAYLCFFRYYSQHYIKTTTHYNIYHTLKYIEESELQSLSVVSSIQKNGVRYPNQDDVLRLEIMSTGNVLVQHIFDIPYNPMEGVSFEVDSIELKDVNNDDKNDLLIHIRERTPESTRIVTHFSLREPDGYYLINMTFSKDVYSFHDKTTLKISEPIFDFGSPYESSNDLQANDSTEPKSPLWFSFYQFNETELNQVNHKFKDFYSNLKNRAKKNLDNTLKDIKYYKMDLSTQELNQMQLNMYFQQITLNKIIIKRCESILEN